VGIFVYGGYLWYMKIIISESQFNRVMLEISSTDTDRFIQRAQDIHKDSEGNPLYDYDLTNYTGAQNKVKIICPRHKDEWKNSTGNEYFEMTANHHLRGRGCKFDYLEKKVKHSDEDITDSAKKYKTYTEFKQGDFPKFNAANKRGKEFFNKISSHFVPAQVWYGEQQIAQILFDMGLIPENCITSKKCGYREKNFSDCTNIGGERACKRLRFDFYLPDQNTLIEYDGEQHFIKRGKYGDKFDSRQQNDKIKNQYCKKKNIKLIRIHYKVPDSELASKLSDALKSKDQQILIGPY
jgi:hypothetical protein